MSATTESPTDFELEVSYDDLEKVIGPDNARVTLELIRDVAANNGVLTDVLTSRLEQHPIYTELSKSDKEAVNRTHGGRRKEFKSLLTKSAIVICKMQSHRRPTSIMGWRGLLSLVNELISSPESNPDTKPEATATNEPPKRRRFSAEAKASRKKAGGSRNARRRSTNN
jgi:hypothetical protein